MKATITTEEIKTIETTKGILKYYRDFDNDGFVVMLNAKTINRYNEIKDQHPDADKCGVFWAFSNEQFQRGYKNLVNKGVIKDGDKLCGGPAGIIGTRKGIDDFMYFYEERDKQIPKECDPQEVYFYEYNNHECCYGWEGDAPAYELIVNYFGEDVAKTIKRI